jgi:hypothetical protein
MEFKNYALQLESQVIIVARLYTIWTKHEKYTAKHVQLGVEFSFQAAIVWRSSL